MEAKQKGDRYQQKVEEAYLLWEADGKPQGKWDYYCKLAEEKLIEEEQLIAKEQLIAEEKLKVKKLPTIYKPYYLLEKRILEPADEWISRQAFFTILGRLGNIAVLAALLSFVFGENYRRNDEIFAAWTTITTAGDQPGSGGRVEALEFLHSRPLKFPWIGWTEKGIYWDESENKCKEKRLWGARWKQQSLSGLSVPNAYLVQINLCSAKLVEANLQNTELGKANLQYANLFIANLQYADLVDANLQNINLFGANLQNAKMLQANLQNANLLRANLQNANLADANLQNTNLVHVNLQNADLRYARNLTLRQIKSACNWKEAKFSNKFLKELERESEREPVTEFHCNKWN